VANPHDISPDFMLVTLVGGPFSAPTIVFPSGKLVTVIVPPIASDTAHVYFRLDGSFALGDVVEVYSTGQGFSLADENGVNVGGGAGGARVRKMLTSALFPGASTWGRIG
jgi:hypothetical protein